MDALPTVTNNSTEPDVTMDVLVFRNRIEVEHRFFAIGDGQAQALLDYLKSLPYDGGTNLAALDFSDLPHREGEAWFLDLDVCISMSWDADLTDVDLHVFEPPSEHAY